MARTLGVIPQNEKYRATKASPMSLKPRLLAIVPADYDALQRKGVLDMVFERDEGGFFERVITIHPVARETRRMSLNDTHVLYEFGLKRFGQFAKRRVLKWLVFVVHFLCMVPKVIVLAREEGVSVVRAHDPYWMGLLGYIVSRLRRIPLCVSLHADYEKRHELTGGGATYTFFGFRLPARLLSNWVLSKADLVMPIRESLAKWAVANGARRDKVRVIPHGLSLEPFLHAPSAGFLESLGIEKNKHIVSFVGRFSKENYIDEIIEVGRRLAMRRQDFTLVLVGGGDDEARIRESILKDELLSRAIIAIGFQPRTVCIQLRMMSTVSLCLMGGFSLIEACMAGSPVVAYDVEWHAELVRSGITGFLIKEHDIADIVRSVEHCMDNPDEAKELGANAKRLAWEKHDIRITSSTKRRCYAELLGWQYD